MPIKSVFPDVKIVETPNLVDHIFSDAANIDPAATSLIDSGTGATNSFDRVRKDIDLVARALHAHRIRKGDVVALCLPNCMEYASIALGTISRGAISCGINPNYTYEEFEFHLTDCTAQLLFVSSESVKNVCRAVRNTGGNQKMVVIGDLPTGDYPPGALTYQEFIAASHSVRDLPRVALNPKTHPACMLYSSGTTGRPKGVLLSHAGLTAAMQLIFESTIFDHPRKGEHVIGMLPMFHIMGLMVTLRVIRLGAVLVVMRKYESEKLLMLVQTYKVRQLYCVPPMLVFLAKDALVDKYDLTSIRSILTGAAPVGKELHEEIMARFPNVTLLNQAFGMTEIGSGSMANPKWKSKPGSCGMLVPNYVSKVVDVDSGKECGPREPGEIWLRGPTFMLGYYRNPKATAETIDKEGWLHTGDIGYYDEEGYFFIVDRLKELIKVKGFQVSPAELEDVLISHPSVDDAAVIAKPDPISGELPKAFVVKAPNANVTAAEIIRFVGERVAYYKRLKGGVEFVDAIPKSASGKILRRALQQREREKAAVSKL